jgi:extradiol dioxygenase family protein
VRDGGDAFHLAIPAYDLAESEHFYVDLLGCKLARRYLDRITLDFFGDQVVCHLTDRPADAGGELDLYPRHFGVTFRHGKDFDAVHRVCVQREVPVFRQVGTRFEGKAEVHQTFVVRDPSDNLIEFKHYADPRMMH